MCFTLDREAGLKEAKDVVKPFDWTFSTSYKGTLLPEAGGFEVRSSTDWMGHL